MSLKKKLNHMILLFLRKRRGLETGDNGNSITTTSTTNHHNQHNDGGDNDNNDDDDRQSRQQSHQKQSIVEDIIPQDHSPLVLSLHKRMRFNHEG
jgi:hypothetical protein